MPIKYNNICKAKCQAPSGTVKVIRVIYDCLLLAFPGSFLRTLLFLGAPAWHTFMLAQSEMVIVPGRH